MMCLRLAFDDVVCLEAWYLHALPGMSSAAEGSLRRIPYFTSLSWKVYLLKIALLDSSSQSSAMTKSQALESNLDVDYVISYRFAKTGKWHVMVPTKAIAYFLQIGRLLSPSSRSCAMPSQMSVCRRRCATETRTQCSSSYA
jgi:hypothetical protein